MQWRSSITVRDIDISFLPSRKFFSSSLYRVILDVQIKGYHFSDFPNLRKPPDIWWCLTGFEPTTTCCCNLSFICDNYSHLTLCFHLVKPNSCFIILCVSAVLLLLVHTIDRPSLSTHYDFYPLLLDRTRSVTNSFGHTNS